MAKLVLNDITRADTQSGVNLINDNSARIEAAFENTLSRDGTSPNQMGADIDLNGNDLLNVKNIDTQELTVKGSGISSLVDRAEAAAEEAKDSAIDAHVSAELAEYWAGQAEQITLPDNSIEFAKLNDTAYDWPKAFGASEGNNAATNDAAFSTLEGTLVGRSVDLGGKTYPITTIPTGNTYENGYWLIENYDETADVRIPAKNTINRTLAKLTSSPAYQSHPQDNWHTYYPDADAEPVLYATYRTRPLGGGKYQAARRISGDGGYTYRPQQILAPADLNRQFWAMANYNGQEFGITRDTGDTYKLLARRLYQMRRLSSAPLSRGTNILYFEEMPDHGVRVGDVVKISNWSGNALNGVTPDGEYTVVASEDTRFGISVTGMVANAGFVSRSLVLEFVEGSFTEVLIGGETFSDAFATAFAEWPNRPTLFMHMETFDAAGGGAFYTGVHGGSGNPSGAYFVRVDGILQTPTFSFVKLIVNPGVEGDVRRDDVGYLYAMVRANGVGDPAYFGWSDDEGDTWTLTAAPAYPFAIRSGVAIRILGDKLFGTLSTGRPENDVGPLTEPEKKPLYLLEANLSDLKTDGWDAFTMTLVHEMNYGQQSTEQYTSYGVQSLVAMPDRLVIGFSSHDAPTGPAPTDGVNVYALVIELEDGSITKGAGREAISWSFVADDDEVPQTRLLARVGTDGTIHTMISDGGLSLTCERTGTGVYAFTFTDAWGGEVEVATPPLYLVLGPHVGNANRIGRWASPTTSGFRIEIYEADGTTAADDNFTLEVVIPRR